MNATWVSPSANPICLSQWDTRLEAQHLYLLTIKRGVLGVEVLDLLMISPLRTGSSALGWIPSDGFGKREHSSASVSRLLIFLSFIWIYSFQSELWIGVFVSGCEDGGMQSSGVEDFEFENQVIQRMELLVLSTLDWQLSSVTPFTYLNYFISKLSEKSIPKTLLLRAMELIFSTTEVMDLVNHRLSAIAAAAVLVASNQSLLSTSDNFKMDVISSCSYLENEHLFSCYNLMRELEKGEIERKRGRKLTFESRSMEEV